MTHRYECFVDRAYNRDTGIFLMGVCPCVVCGCAWRDAADETACARCGANVTAQTMGQRVAFAFSCRLAAAKAGVAARAWTGWVLAAVKA